MKTIYEYPVMIDKSCKPIDIIPKLLTIKSNENTPTCISFAKWEESVKYINLYYDLNDEKYKAVEHKIWVTDCRLDYNAFNKLHDVFKDYMYADNFDKGYFGIIPPTDKKLVNKLNKQIKKALG